MSKKQQSVKKEVTAGKSGKKEIKGATQQNILQTLKNQIDFLNIFTSGEIHFLFQNYDVIVFERGMVLAKENQIIDFVGVILNGGAIAQKSKAKYKKNSFIGHAGSFFGLEGHKHPETITAESQGILFSIRIQALLNPSKNEIQNGIKNKILKFMAQQTLFQLKGERQFNSTIQSYFQIIDEKISQKFQQSNKFYSSILQSLCDQKEKEKFLEQFPLFSAKEKTLIMSRHSKPSLLLLLKGQITIKFGLGLKKQSKTLQVNNLYNVQGFIFDHNQFSNLYCSSSEAIFLLVDKERLINNFKLMSIAGIFKYLLQHTQKLNDYSLGNLVILNQQNQLPQSKQIWSPFKKSYQIQEIPIKSFLKTQTKSNNNKKKDSVNAFQTLYQTYSNVSKNKLKSKETQMTETFGMGFQKSRIPTSTVMKTQYSTDQKKIGNSTNQQLKKLETDLQVFKAQNQSLVQNIKKIKLDLLESQSKLKLIEVFRQIRNSKGLKQTQSFGQKVDGKTENRSLTLKEAFSSHLKNKKLQLLVAKCAYKWLSFTRQNKTKRGNQSSGSLLLKSMPRIQS